MTTYKEELEELKTWFEKKIKKGLIDVHFGHNQKDVSKILKGEPIDIDKEGWVAFNIKETFLYNTDESGFSKLIRELIFSEYLNINHLERYRHRLSIEGTPLFYFSVVCWKRADIPVEFIKKLNIEE